jgi:translation initiation factor IF-1
MSKENIITATGKITELLPNALFKVTLENGITILGHLSGKLRVNNVNILLNDTVDVEISAYDLTKCRIYWRHKRIRS